jgi:hypothetical protein
MEDTVSKDKTFMLNQLNVNIYIYSINHIIVDSLETSFSMTVSLPLSLQGTL